MPNYCTGQIYLISNAIFISFVLPWFDIYPDFLVKLLSLLFEPPIGVFSVYGEPESSGSVLVGFKLQDNSSPETYDYTLSNADRPCICKAAS